MQRYTPYLRYRDRRVVRALVPVPYRSRPHWASVGHPRDWPTGRCLRRCLPDFTGPDGEHYFWPTTSYREVVEDQRRGLGEHVVVLWRYRVRLPYGRGLHPQDADAQLQHQCDAVAIWYNQSTQAPCRVFMVHDWAEPFRPSAAVAVRFLPF